MKYLSLVFLLLCSCSPCGNEDCPAQGEFSFKLLSEEGKSLTGVNVSSYAIPFTSDSIGVSGLTPAVDEVPIKLYQVGSTLTFQLDPQIEDYVIWYAFAKDDTLSFENDVYSSECCGEIVGEYSLSINGMEQPVNNDSVYVFVK